MYTKIAKMAWKCDKSYNGYLQRQAIAVTAGWCLRLQHLVWTRTLLLLLLLLLSSLFLFALSGQAFSSLFCSVCVFHFYCSLFCTCLLCAFHFPIRICYLWDRSKRVKANTKGIKKWLQMTSLTCQSQFKGELHHFSPLFSTAVSSHVTRMICPLWYQMAVCVLFGRERK